MKPPFSKGLKEIFKNLDGSINQYWQEQFLEYMTNAEKDKKIFNYYLDPECKTVYVMAQVGFVGLNMYYAFININSGNRWDEPVEEDKIKVPKRFKKITQKEAFKYLYENQQ